MAEPDHTTVLVSAAGSAPAQAVMRGLANQSDLAVRLVGVDTTAYSAGLYRCDSRYTVPRVDDPDFLEAISAVCAQEAVDVVVPVADFELELFARAADRLAERGIRVLTNSPECVAVARDKRVSAERVAASGVAVPRFHDGESEAELPLPAIVKPRAGAGSQGVSVVHNAAELPQAITHAGEDAVIQEFIEGEEYTVDLVVAPTGEVLAAAPRIRVEVRAGQSYKGVTVDDPQVEAAARVCAAAVGLTGPGNVQLIRSAADDRCYFIEVNPKFGAAMGLTIGAGLNLPLLYLKLSLGLSIGEHELRRAARIWLLRSWEDRVVAESEIGRVPSWTTAGEPTGGGVRPHARP